MSLGVGKYIRQLKEGEIDHDEHLDRKDEKNPELKLQMGPSSKGYPKLQRIEKGNNAGKQTCTKNAGTQK